MNKWTLFLMSIGFLFISISYITGNPTVFIIAGVCMVIISSLLLLRDRKK